MIAFIEQQISFPPPIHFVQSTHQKKLWLWQYDPFKDNQGPIDYRLSVQVPNNEIWLN